MACCVPWAGPQEGEGNPGMTGREATTKEPAKEPASAAGAAAASSCGPEVTGGEERAGVTAQAACVTDEAAGAAAEAGMTDEACEAWAAEASGMTDQAWEEARAGMTAEMMAMTDEEWAGMTAEKWTAMLAKNKPLKYGAIWAKMLRRSLRMRRLMRRQFYMQQYVNTHTTAEFRESLKRAWPQGSVVPESGLVVTNNPPYAS